MYVREQPELEEKKLTLVVSGKLWNRSLVMLDEETESLWSHILGKAMDGKMKGTVLETLPSTMVDWRTWKTDHPETTVPALSRTSPHYLKEFHEETGRFVLGLREGTRAKSYGFDVLERTPVINDEFGGNAVVVVYRPEAAGGRAFLRTADGKTLRFERAGPNKLKDRGTGSLWNLESGTCEEGALQGRQLEEIPAVVSFRRVWEVFYPGNQSYQSR